METKINEIEVNGIKYVPKSNVNNTAADVDGLQCCIVRTYAAGVFYGYIKEKTYTPSGLVVSVVNARRIWSWSGSASLSQMAIEGVKNAEGCKFSMPCNEELINVIELLPVTENALSNLNLVPEWKK